jgi:carboxyl-terminal processing protease
MKFNNTLFQSRKKYFIVTGIVILALIPISAIDNYFEVSKNLEIYSDIYKELNIYYVDDINSNQLMRKGIDAMLGSLDPYTNYYSEAEMENFRFQTTGKYGGIGAIIRKKDDYMTIIEPYENSPAVKAGLKAGDLIIEIDGKSTSNKSVEEVSKILKGSPGTNLSMKVKRFGSNELIPINLAREEINVDNVPYYGMLNENIGYINLNQFTQKAGKNVENALKSLKDSNDVKGLMLDLRGNPGGLLNEAVNLVNVFLDKNKLVVSTKGRVTEWNRDFKTINQPLDTKIPIIVLVNSNSASASEIVAGTLQDYDRGIILGTRTYGKGLVQQTRDISYKTKLKLTIAKYYIPSGRLIQAIDYSHRNKDGSISKIPDSLKNEFKTANGRSVYDGGGIEPDIEVENQKISKISISLLTKDLIFDYATAYYYSHDTIVPAKDFKLSDSDFDDFVAYLSDKKYDYITKSEKLLESLEKNTKDEKYYDAVKQTIEELKTNIKHDKEKDLFKYKEEIIHLLVNEIVSRYYYKKGRTEASFGYDPLIKEAISLLKDQNRYSKVLSSGI